jgi:hypothetical protein
MKLSLLQAIFTLLKSNHYFDFTHALVDGSKVVAFEDPEVVES